MSLLPDSKALRSRLRELLAKVPPGMGEWSHTRAVMFKNAHRAAARAADHPLASRWTLRDRVRELETFHKPQSCQACYGIGYDSSGLRCESCQS